MPKIVDDENRKETITLRLSKFVIVELRKHKNYNVIVEEAIKEKLNIKETDVDK